MIQTLLRLRFHQLVRALKEVGAMRLILFAPLGGLVLFVILNFVRQGLHMEFIALLLGSSLFSLHLRRQDKGFMRILQWPAGWVYSVEYTLLLLPYLIACGFSPTPWYGAGLWLLVLGMAWIPFTWRKKSRNFLRRIPLIPPLAFEWKSGLRQAGLAMGLLYILCLGFSWEPAVAPIFLLVSSLLTTSFYLQGESQIMLESCGLSGRQFIRRKVGLHLLIFWTLHLPFLVLMLVQLWSTWPVILYTLIGCSSIQTVAILYKYALYQPNADLRRNFLFIGLATISFFVPPMVPVPFFLIARNWSKSIHNVNRYFYA